MVWNQGSNFTDLGGSDPGQRASSMLTPAGGLAVDTATPFRWLLRSPPAAALLGGPSTKDGRRGSSRREGRGGSGQIAPWDL